MFPIIPFVRPRRRHPSPATTTSPNTTDVRSLGPPLRPIPNYARIPSHQGTIGGPSVWVLEYPGVGPCALGRSQQAERAAGHRRAGHHKNLDF